MPASLDATAVRVLGSLVEKALATPDQYPLSLAALTAACNQKTSRDPVMALEESAVRDALDGLLAESMVRERDGGRVSRFSHRLDDALGLRFGFDTAELAVLAVLMLRGPQTGGELRTRTERMAGGAIDPAAVLERLRTHAHGPWVAELEREPGRRENRWMHLLGDDTLPPPVPAMRAAPAAVADDAASTVPEALFERLDELTSRVADLESQLARLRTDEPDD